MRYLIGLFVLNLISGCGYLATRGKVTGPRVVDGQVAFRFYAPGARRVQLAGDWPQNNWARGDGSVGEANIGLMEDSDGDGVWEIRIALPAGRYCYLFWVDELSWYTDPGNPEEVRGGPARICSQLVVRHQNGRLEIK